MHCGRTEDFHYQQGRLLNGTSALNEVWMHPAAQAWVRASLIPSEPFWEACLESVWIWCRLEKNKAHHFIGVQTLIAFIVAKSLKTRPTHIAKPQLKTFQLLYIKKCLSGHRFPAGTSGTPTDPGSPSSLGFMGCFATLFSVSKFQKHMAINSFQL